MILTCFCMQALPVAIANLFQEELKEARTASGVCLVDPGHSACAVLIQFVNWYGIARKAHGSLGGSRMQVPSKCIMTLYRDVASS